MSNKNIWGLDSGDGCTLGMELNASEQMLKNC